MKKSCSKTRGIPAIKIDISFRADSSPPKGRASSTHTGDHQISHNNSVWFFFT